MRRRSPDCRQRWRPGIALLMAVVMLVLVASVMGTVAWQTSTSRRLFEHRHEQLQVTWLARAGIECACARLLAEPEGYTGESLELIPQGEVHLQIQRDPKTSNAFRIVSEARYPTDVPHPDVRKVTCQVRRVVEGQKARLEVKYVPAR